MAHTPCWEFRDPSRPDPPERTRIASCRIPFRGIGWTTGIGLKAFLLALACASTLPSFPKECFTAWHEAQDQLPSWPSPSSVTAFCLIVNELPGWAVVRDEQLIPISRDSDGTFLGCAAVGETASFAVDHWGNDCLDTQVTLHATDGILNVGDPVQGLDRIRVPCTLSSSTAGPVWIEMQLMTTDGSTTLEQGWLKVCFDATPDDPVIDTFIVTVADDPARTLWPNGRSFSQDAVASFNGAQYAAWWDAENRLCAGRRLLPDNSWEVMRFDDYLIQGGDAHENTVIGICAADGTLHLSFDQHVDPLHYRVTPSGVASSPAPQPWDPTLFGETLNHLPGQPAVDQVTYPRFVSRPDGGLQFWFRRGSSGNGNTLFHQYDPIAGVWNAALLLISKSGTYGESTSRNAYLNGVTFDSTGNLHITWTWREPLGPGGVENNHDLMYAWSPDSGVSWFNSSGQLLSLPITVDSPGIVVWPFPMGSGLINQCGQAIDSEGRIHVMYAPVEMHQGLLHFWRDVTGTWHRYRLPIFGGRPKLALDAQGNLFALSSGLQILASSEESLWCDWTEVHAPWPIDLTPWPEPLYDANRWQLESVLSVFHQFEAQIQIIDITFAQTNGR